METVIATEGLCKNFGEGELQIKALKDVDLSIVRGEFTAIVGPSGSGKTTLLNILCGLGVPSSGEIRVSGNPLSTLNGSELARFRRDHIGLVFQAYNLIPVLTVMENIEYVMLLQGISAKEKLFLQILMSLAIGVYLLYFDPSRIEYATRLSVPFFKDFQPELGFSYLLFIVFIVVCLLYTSPSQRDGLLSRIPSSA